MRRLIVVLTMTAMLVAMSLTVPAGAQEFYEGFGTKGEEEEPGEVYCEWFGPFEEPPYDPWWEYWCWYGDPYWEWYFVLWVYA